VLVPETQPGICPPVMLPYTLLVSVFESVPAGEQQLKGPKFFWLPPLSVMRR